MPPISHRAPAACALAEARDHLAVALAALAQPPAGSGPNAPLALLHALLAVQRLATWEVADALAQALLKSRAGARAPAE